MAKAPKGRRTAKHIDWAKIRALWEADPLASFKSLERGGFAARQTISRRAKREGWTKVDPNDSEVQKAINARVAEKAVDNPVEVLPPESPPAAAGVPSPLAKHAAIEARATIIDRHRRELNIPRNRLYSAMQDTRNSETFSKLKEAKITAEALSIIQAAERKAWGLDGDPTIVFQVIPPSQRDQHD